MRTREAREEGPAGTGYGNPAAVDHHAALWCRGVSGDVAAFEEPVSRRRRRAWAFAWRMPGDAAGARDVMQEAFLRIFRAASRLPPGCRVPH